MYGFKLPVFMTDTILIIGANGQLGTVLTKSLQNAYGLDRVIASDIHRSTSFEGRFEILDANQFEAIMECLVKYKITQVYHLAAILSANGEKRPIPTWNLNMNTYFNVLEAARLAEVSKVFFPSSIAVFGDHIPKIYTPQNGTLIPSTVYGMSKVAGENWSHYYFKRYGLDVRSIRYPGIIGYQSLPGGGTTDYAVDIFHKAVAHQVFECFLKPDAMLPMIYMDDAIRATMELMEAPSQNISVRTGYNVAGMSFTPAELAQVITGFFSDFKISYQPDFRQNIADSWPESIDDTPAQKDWNWKPAFDLMTMTRDMIKQLTPDNSIKP